MMLSWGLLKIWMLAVGVGEKGGRTTRLGGEGVGVLPHIQSEHSINMSPEMVSGLFSVKYSVNTKASSIPSLPSVHLLASPPHLIFHPLLIPPSLIK
jgi:hypothetical protein